MKPSPMKFCNVGEQQNYELKNPLNSRHCAKAGYAYLPQNEQTPQVKKSGKKKEKSPTIRNLEVPSTKAADYYTEVFSWGSDVQG